jgi:hypothetical protein
VSRAFGEGCNHVGLIPAESEKEFYMAHETKAVKEKRRYKRWGVELTFSYEIKEFSTADPSSTPPIGTAVIENISFGGAKIASYQELAKGMLLEITLIPLVVAGTIHATGRVVWSQRDESDVYHSGIEFIAFREGGQQVIEACLSELAAMAPPEEGVPMVNSADIEEF